MAGKNQNQVKKTTTNINSKWLQNTLKSLGIAGTNVIKELMPATAETVTTASRTAVNTAKELRGAKVGRGGIAKVITNNPAFQMGNDFVKNALEDIRTGNLYNQERQEQAMNAFMGMDGDDGFSFGDMDEEYGSGDNITVNNVVQDDGATLRAIQKQSEYSVRGTKATVDAMVSIASTNMTAMGQIGAEVISQLTSINSNIAALVEYNNTNMTKFINASVGYYEQMAASLEPKGSSPTSRVGQENIFGSSGGLDVGSYAEYVKNNIKDMTENSLVGGAVQMALSMKDSLVANPLGTIMESVLKKAVPEIMKSSMTALDNTLQDFVPVMLERIGEMGETADGQFAEVTRAISRIFGIRTQRKTNFDYSKIEKGPVPWNGMANHTLVEIIPKYLRESNAYLKSIAEAVTSKSSDEILGGAQGYDWATGKFTSLDEMRDTIYNQISSEVESAFGRSKFGKEMQSKVSLLSSDKDREAYDKALSDLFNAIERREGLIDLKNQDQFKEVVGSVNANDNIKNLITASIQQMLESDPSIAGSIQNAKRIASQKKNNSMNYLQENASENALYQLQGGKNYDEWVKSRNAKVSTQNATVSQRNQPLKPDLSSSLSTVRSIYHLLNRGIYVKIKKGLDKADNRAQRNENLRNRLDRINPFSPTEDTGEVKSVEDYKNMMQEEEGPTPTPVTDTSTSGRVAERINAYNGIMKGILAGNSDQAWDSFMNGLQESFKKAGDFLGEHFFTPMKEHLFGKKNEAGYTEGGIFEGVNNRMKESFFSLRRMITGKGYVTADGQVIQDATEDEMGETVAGKLKSMLNGIKHGIHVKLFGESTEVVDEDGNVTTVDKDGIIKKASNKLISVADSLTQGLQGWSDALFGKNHTDDQEEETEGVLTRLKNFASKVLPDSLFGGVVGLGGTIAMSGGLLAGLVGGPIGGALIGMGAGIAAKSDKFQNWLFGEKDEQGDRTGGLISKGVQDFVKEHGAFLTGSAALGAVKGIFRPGTGMLVNLVGGPVAGAIMGLGTGIILKSKMFQKFLYGDEAEGQKGLVNIVKGWFKGVGSKDGDASGSKMAGMLAIGGAAGAITGAMIGKIGFLGLSLGPAGPIGGALFGLGAGILAQKDNFHEWLFGKDLEDGRHKEGILGQFKNMLSVHVFGPIKDTVADIADDAKIFIEYDILKKFNVVLQPVADIVGNAISAITGGAVQSLSDIGTYIKEDFLVNVVDHVKNVFAPLTDAVTSVAKGIYGIGKRIIAAPLNIIGAITSPIARGIANTVTTVLGTAVKGIDFLIVKPIENLVIKPLGVIVGGIGKVIAAPFQLLAKAADFINEKVVGAINHVTKFVHAVQTEIHDAVVKHVLEPAKNWINTKLIQPVKDTFAKIGNFFLTPIRVAGDFLKDKISEIGDAVKASFNNSIKKAFNFLTSPFRLIGKGIGKLLGIGKDNQGQGLFGHLRDLWDQTSAGNFVKREGDSVIVQEDNRRRARQAKLEEAKQKRIDRKNKAYNRKLIAKYTGNQLATDTEENRKIAAAASGRELSWRGDADDTKEKQLQARIQQDTLDAQVRQGDIQEETRDEVKGIRDILKNMSDFMFGKSNFADIGERNQFEDIADELIIGGNRKSRKRKRRQARRGRRRTTPQPNQEPTQDQPEVDVNVTTRDILGDLSSDSPDAIDFDDIGDFLQEELRSIKEESQGDGSGKKKKRRSRRRNRRRGRQEEAIEWDDMDTYIRSQIGDNPDGINKFARGTKHAKRGPAIVGEEGPEIVYMEGGERVVPNNELDSVSGTSKLSEEEIASTTDDTKLSIGERIIKGLSGVKSVTGGFMSNLFGGKKLGKKSGGTGSSGPKIDLGMLKDTDASVGSPDKEKKGSFFDLFKKKEDQKKAQEEVSDLKGATLRDEMEAKREEESDDATQEGILENIEKLTEGNKKHHTIWDSIFSKKGLITGALIAAIPLLLKVGKWLLGGGLSNVLSNAMAGLGNIITNVASGIGATLGNIIDQFKFVQDNAARENGEDAGERLEDNLEDLADLNLLSLDEDGGITNQSSARLKLGARIAQLMVNSSHTGRFDSRITRLIRGLGGAGKSAIKTGVAGVKSAASLAAKGAKGLAGKTVSLGKGLASGVKGAGAAVGRAGTRMVYGAGSMANRLANSRLGTAVGRAGGAAWNVAKDLGSRTLGVATDIGTGVANIARGAGSKVASGATTLAHNIATSRVGTAVGTAGRAIGSAGKAVGSTLASAGSKVAGGVANVATKIGDSKAVKGVAKVAEKISTSGGKLLSHVTKVVSEFFETMAKKCGVKASKAFSKLTSGTIVKTISSHFSKISSKISSLLASKGGLAAVTAGLSEAVFITLSAINGVSGARKLFKVSEVDGKMVAIAGVFGAIAGTTPGAIIEVVAELISDVMGVDLLSSMATGIYNALSSEEDRAKLTDAQEDFQNAYLKYQDETVKEQYETQLKAGIISSDVTYEMFAEGVVNGDYSVNYDGFDDWNTKQNMSLSDKITNTVGKGMTSLKEKFIKKKTTSYTDASGNVYTKGKDGNYSVTSSTGESLGTVAEGAVDTENWTKNEEEQLGLLGQIGDDIKNKFIPKVKEVIGSVTESLAPVVSGLVDGIKKIAGFVIPKYGEIGLTAIRGDVEGVAAIDVVAPEDVPMAGVWTILGSVTKVSALGVAGVSWVGQQVMKLAGKLLKGIAKIGGGILPITGKLLGKALTGDPQGVMGVDTKVDEDVPLSGVWSGVMGVAKVISLAVSGVMWAGIQVAKGIGNFIGGVVKIGANILPTYANLIAQAVTGDPAGVNAVNVVVPEDVPLSGVFTGVGCVVKLVSLAVSGIFWVGKKLFEGIGSFINGVKTIASANWEVSSNLAELAYAGDVEGVAAAETDVPEDVPLSGVWNFLNGISKFMYSGIAHFNRFSKGVKEGVSNFIGSLGLIGEIKEQNKEELQKLSDAGDVGGIMDLDTDVPEETPFAGLWNFLNAAGKIPYIIGGGIKWIGNSIWDGVKDTKFGMKITDISDYITRLNKYTDPKKDMSGFDKEKMGDGEGLGVDFILQPVIKYAMTFYVNLVRGFKNIGESIKDAITSFTGGIGDWFSDVGDFVVDWANGDEGGGGGRGTGTRRGGRGIQTLNGAAYYSQNDPRWANQKFIKSDGTDDGATMSSAGCGPTAMAMIVDTMNAKKVSPLEMAKFAQRSGERDETGTNWDFVTKASQEYGLHSKLTQSPTAQYLIDTVSSGNPVLLSGTDDGKGLSPYTTAGHYIVAVGVDKNGNILVNDPRGPQYSKAMNPNELSRYTSAVWSFNNNPASASVMVSGGSGNRNNIIRFVRGGRGSRDKWIAVVQAVKAAIAAQKPGYDSYKYVNVTIGGKSLKIRTDCSGMVSAALIYYGVLPDSGSLGSVHFTDQNNASMLASGFKARNFAGWDQLEAGDILAKNGHVEIFAGTQGGSYYVYNCGSNNSVNNPSYTYRSYDTYTTVWAPGEPGAGCISDLTVSSTGLSVGNTSAEASGTSYSSNQGIFSSYTGSNSSSSSSGGTDIFSRLSSAFSSIGNRIMEAVFTTTATGSKTDDGGSGRGRKRGGRGDILNGIPYYSQNDPRWRDNPYLRSDGTDDGATFANSGCGPTAMAMALSSVTGRPTDPRELATIAQSTGNRDDTGTNWNFVDEAASAYGVESARVERPGYNTLSRGLDSGTPLLLSGQSDSGPYTSEGHYIVATGKDNNGNVYVNDPRGKSYSNKVNIRKLAQHTNAAWKLGGSGVGARRNRTGHYVRGGRGAKNFEVTKIVDTGVTGASQAWVFRPKEKTKAKLPMVIFLHGHGERGKDMYVIAGDDGQFHGKAWVPKWLYDGDLTCHCIFVAPHLDSESYGWSQPPVYAGLMDWIRKLIVEENANPDRVSIMGQSGGSVGAAAILSGMPDVFSAGLLFCGYDSAVAKGSNMTNFPILAFSGSGDRDSVNSVTNLYQKVSSAGGNMTLFIVNGETHDSIVELMFTYNLFAWLIAQSRGKNRGTPGGIISINKGDKIKGVAGGSGSSYGTSVETGAAISADSYSLGADATNVSSVYSDSSGSSDNSFLGRVTSALGNIGNKIAESIMTGDFSNIDWKAVIRGEDTGSSTFGSADYSNLSATNITGSDNEEKTWNYLTSHGYTKHGAAALMGNLRAESGVRPNNLQDSANDKLGLSDEEYTAKLNSGEIDGNKFVNYETGYGLAQWTSAGRKQGLYNATIGKGMKADDLGAQLDFLNSEMQGGYKGVYDVLTTTNDVKVGSDMVLHKFEKPDNQSTAVENLRASYGLGYYERYGGGNGEGVRGGRGSSVGRIRYGKHGTGYYAQGGRSGRGLTGAEPVQTTVQTVSLHENPLIDKLSNTNNIMSDNAKLEALLLQAVEVLTTIAGNSSNLELLKDISSNTGVSTTNNTVVNATNVNGTDKTKTSTLNRNSLGAKNGSSGSFSNNEMTARKIAFGN